ncbi:Lysophospholipase, alpha-beta hydrolase superfamily [Thermoactinomyces sp. DSM 45891]|uniref:alpha/beta fold hydrolase n=1 Tax=Thermoactinomyces sp. DSM 45891 TaxID=1761907 RepID=UPI000915B9F3|nr:alpha/beta hydrolase [Thermoactinomyces sp. DSM 45891]SFX57011.1 Lysophospholipase, alpha-beta hydrolase superfamily [Thermoactinomyces sp. DSM 45891]
MESNLLFSSQYSVANIHRHENKKCCFVLVHGFSESAVCWDDMINPIKDHANFITYDCVGHGNNAHLWELASFPAYVQQLDDLVSYLKEKECFQKMILVGHSQGAGIVAQYSIQNPTNVDGLILISPFLYIGAPLRALWTNFLQLVEQGEMRRFWDLNSSLLLGPKSESWSQFRESSMQERLNFFTKEQLVMLLNALLHIEVTGDLSTLKNKPMYLIHGQYDLMFPSYYSKEIQSQVLEAEYIEVEGANHLLIELESAVYSVMLKMMKDTNKKDSL